MIVSALVKRYEDAPDVPVGWQVREVSYALNINENGELLDVILKEYDEISGKRKIKRKTKLTLPLEFGRQGAKAYEVANFLCDDGNYMLGLDPLKFESARRFHEALLKDVDTPQAQAILRYFNAGIPPFPEEKLDRKTAATSKFYFQFDEVGGGNIDYGNEAIRNVWDVFYRREEGEAVLCLVTGEEDIPLSSHSVLHLRGGQMSGSRLISANAESFTSYGKTAKDRAADVGKYAAFAYVTALSALLKDEKHRQFIGEDTLVFWAEKGGEAEEALFGNLLSPPRADEDGELVAALGKIAQGDMATAPALMRRFYLLCLSPNAARISVRFFYQSAFGDLIRNIQAHYDRLDIVSDNRTPFRFLPPWLILSETTVKGSASDASPLLGGQLLRSILTGTDYPLTLYHAILTRLRAGGDITKAKVAVIKATLIKNFNESEVATVALNEESINKPYVLGRLFSVLERLQERANSSATIRARYFTSACANPGSVFPTLLNLSMHHAAKLDNAVFYEKLKTELLGKLDEENPFPAAFSLDDQGRFILGYYHQTQWFFTKKDQTEG